MYCGEDGLCVCVGMCLYLELLSHFLPIKISLTNISPILIKIVDFKNLAWATSFATRASRKFIYLPYRASGKKSYCQTLWCNQDLGMSSRINDTGRDSLNFWWPLSHKSKCHMKRHTGEKKENKQKLNQEIALTHTQVFKIRNNLEW